MQYNLADMTPENAAAMEPQPAGMGELARLTGVFFEPGKTFADVAQRPTWFVPMLVTVLFGLIFCAVVGQRIGWDNIAQQQMEKRMATAPQEQRDARSEEHTSELQSPCNLVCRLLLEKK